LGLQEDYNKVVAELLEIEVASVPQVELKEESLKKNYHYIPISHDVYVMLKELKKKKKLSWDALILWLVEVARAKKGEVKVKCESEDLDVEKFLSILNILGIDLSSLIGGRKK
jgi:predicted CopG family antitoxin